MHLTIAYMTNLLTIAYMTNRPDPKIRWFFDSLRRETGGDYTGIKVVVVDFFRDLPTRHLGDPSIPGRERYHQIPLTHVAPKPSVWQGPHRLTKQDYFAASNARNTAICHAPDGWIAFVDDLSVLMPGWLNAVREAMAAGYIVLGAYQKHRKMVVEDGVLISSEPFAGGIDSRWSRGDDNAPVVAAGSWLFGCSLAAPVQAFLDINGFPEICDSLGMEDCAAGIMLERAGYHFRYDRRMLTIESEEDHAQLPVFLREDPCRGDPNRRPRDDMSHAALRIFADCGSSHPGYWGPGGIAALRQQILAGKPFPIPAHPEHRWFDGVPLSQLPQ